MGNNNLFKALSSQTRMKIMKILLHREIHLSELAKEIGISVPVTLRHVNILLETGLIKKRIIGNVHLLSANMEVLEKILEPFVEESLVEINKNDNLFDALQQLPGVEIKRVGDNQFITSIDGQRGYYIYEVDGVIPKKSIDKIRPQKNVILHLKKLISVDKKKIEVKIKNNK
jgi:DNA-binding transcriptional ArsR family regulator